MKYKYDQHGLSPAQPNPHVKHQEDRVFRDGVLLVAKRELDQFEQDLKTQKEILQQ